jgi:hypothetical protein
MKQRRSGKSKGFYYGAERMMMLLSFILLLSAFLITFAFGQNIITLTPSTTYQTWRGWGTYLYACSDPGDCPLAWPDRNIPLWAERAYDTAVNDLGITMLFLSMFSNSQHTENYWAEALSICDSKGWSNKACWNAYQSNSGVWRTNGRLGSIVANSSTFHWDCLDWQMNTVGIPLRRRILASGQKVLLSARIEDRGYGSSGVPSRYGFCDYPADYGRFWVNFFNHMKNTYGFVPDFIDIVNEPDTAKGLAGFCWRSGWTIGKIIKTVGETLAKNSYHPKFFAPSCMDTRNAVAYFNDLWSIAGAGRFIDSISYHKYSGNSSCTAYDCSGSGCKDIAAIGTIVSRFGINSSMNEMINSSYATLHTDIKCGNVSSWDGMYALVGPSTGNGGSWMIVTDDSKHALTLSDGAKLIRQYSKFIRPGAVRIGANGTSTFDPVAFINPGGGYVVVVKVTSPGGKFSIEGLPGGKYGIKYTIPDGPYDQDLADQSIADRQNLTTKMIQTGVMTIYRKPLQIQ